MQTSTNDSFVGLREGLYNLAMRGRHADAYAKYKHAYVDDYDKQENPGAHLVIIYVFSMWISMIIMSSICFGSGLYVKLVVLGLRGTIGHIII